jgi:hypothetical protein
VCACECVFAHSQPHFLNLITIAFPSRADLRILSAGNAWQIYLLPDEMDFRVKWMKCSGVEGKYIDQIFVAVDEMRFAFACSLLANLTGLN